MKAWIASQLLLSVLLVTAGCGISGNDNDGKVPENPVGTDGLQIENVQVGSLSDSSATLSWSTTRNAGCTTFYNTNRDALSFTETTPPGSSHLVSLDALEEDTEYHYQITCRDALQNSAQTEVLSFRTTVSSDRDDDTPPVISNITVTGITTSSATISWTTDDRCIGNVAYGLNEFGTLTTAYTPEVYSRSHSVVLQGIDGDDEDDVLDGLQAGTHYFFRITATNRSAPSPLSSTSRPDGEFDTAEPPTLSIDPPTKDVTPGEEFDLNIRIENSTNLAGLQFVVTYPTSYFEVLSLRRGPFASHNNGGFMFQNANSQTNFPVIGDVTWEILFEDGIATGAASGSEGIVAILKVRVKGITIDRDVEGHFVFEVASEADPKTRLLDHHRDEIRPVSVRKGTVTVKG